MPRTQAVGATPPKAPRGPVTPPPTRACGSTAWIPSYPGLSRCWTYPRPRWPKPEPLVRLVPDQPIANPGVAPGGCGREAAEVPRPRRGEIRRAPPVRPRRRPDQRDHGRQTVAAKATQNPVRPTPVVGAIARRGRLLRPSQGYLVPAEREADERHAEPLEGRQPLVESPRSELQPRVVLDPVAGRPSKRKRNSLRRRSRARRAGGAAPSGRWASSSAAVAWLKVTRTSQRAKRGHHARLPEADIAVLGAMSECSRSDVRILSSLTSA